MNPDDITADPGRTCESCRSSEPLGFDFTMAFQPIIDVRLHEIYAYEALARGLNNEPAGELFRRINVGNRYRFDQACRVKAIRLAARLRIPCLLSINFMPNAVYRPELCLRTTLKAAEAYGFPIERIIFEVTESEEVVDHAHLQNIVSHYKGRGFLTAIDDFGAGYAGLNLLAEFKADLVKLDMALLRGIDHDRSRQAIVKGILGVCEELSIRVIAEGVETRAEYEVLHDFGIELFQGYLFARPAFEALPEVAPGWLLPAAA